MTDQQLSLFAPLTTPSPAPDRSERLAACAAAAATCTRCALSHTRTKVVYGMGNPNAPMMLIGEGPGQQEDETGLPFVGRAGQLLDKILASVGLSRERDVFICNTLKCRPPNNRVPAPDEIKACRPWLDEQIEILNPRIILLAGATAMKARLDIKEGITKTRGKWLDRDGRLYMVIFHPSYLLRSDSREVGSPKWLMWQDIQEIRRKYDEIVATGN